jgi:hypothetical protein
MKIITQGMMMNFNYFLRDENSIIKLKASESKSKTIDITLLKDAFLDMEDQIINPTKSFYSALEAHFLKEGIEIEYNNTKSCFWVKQ